MIIKSRATRLAALALAAAGIAAAVPAQADDPLPAPTSCAGVWVTDSEGDQVLSALGVVNTGHKTPDNTDVIGAFWRYVPENGKNVLTANVQLKKLDKTVEPGSLGTLWYVYFDIGDYTWFVNARLSSAGAFTFHYGDLGETAAGNSTQGDTTGKVFEGDKGILQIVVPLDKINAEGKTLANGHVDAKVDFGNYIPTVDRAPDGSGAAKSYQASPCAEGITPTPVTPAPGGGGATPTATPGGGGAPAPTTGGGSTAPASASAPTPSGLNLKVIAGKLSANKVKKRKSLSVGLDAGEKISTLKATLLKGSTAVGTGSLSHFGPGNATLKLKIAKKLARKFKRGTYTLSFKGTRPNGTTGTARVQVAVKK